MHSLRSLAWYRQSHHSFYVASPLQLLSQVLGDETKRQQYDMLGSAQYQASQQGGGGHQWAGQGGFSGGNINPEDLFRKIFEEFSGGGGGAGYGGAGGARAGGFEDFQEYAPLEVRRKAPYTA